MNALQEARPSTAAAKSRLSVLTTFDWTDSNSALHTHTLTSSTPAGNGTPAGGLDAGSGGMQLARPGTPGTPSRSSYAIVASELLAASSPHAPASPKPARTDRSGLLNSLASSSSPTAAQVLGAAGGEFDRLLSGKVSRARASIIAAQPVSLDTAGPAAAAAADLAGTLASKSSTIRPADRPASPAAAASRVSLATVGLLAAPDAGLLPGSPLADAAAAGVAAALFSGNSSSNSTSGAGRSSVSGRPQPLLQLQQQQHGVSPVAGAVLQQNTTAAARRSSAGGLGMAAALLQIAPMTQQGSNSKTAAVGTGAQGYLAKLHASQPAAEQSSATSAGASSSSTRERSKQTGSAAFKTTSRDKASRVGRVAALSPDAPGPGHYRPQHGPTDKHLPAAHIVPAASGRPISPGKSATAAAAAVAQEQQPPEPHRHTLQQHRASTDLPTSAAAAAAGTITLLATRGSATGTPRTEEGDAGSPLGLQPHRVHARQPPRKGTSSFQAVSREQLQRQQRPASAGAAGGPGGAAADYFREGYDSLTRPRSSRGPVAVFDKQLPRPASAAMLECSSPAALGPGAYHRSGQLPASYTGADVPAGHVISSGGGALEFDKYCSRPGSSPAAAASDDDGGGSLLQGATAADWPGLWGWAAAADGCPHQTGHLTGTFTCAAAGAGQQQAAETDWQQQQQHREDCVPQKQRPSSRDALAYVRRHFPTELVDLQEACEDRRPAAAPEQQQQIWQQQQLLQLRQLRPKSGHHPQRQAAAKPRPASAVLTRPCGSLGTSSFTAAAAAAAHRPRTAGATSGGGSSSRQDGMLGLQQVGALGSTGIAPRVKGGAWSSNSRAAAARVMRAMSVGSVIPPASVAVLQPGTELAYEPNPEVLGHMHKTPAWSMPPNRTATSKMWAQAAMKAGLQ
uniref:Uncharacterized protein n=1 Tax=Tetradesmus obliquus TaxID=3088 RepID=A0A383WCS0_TETOB|eukprot:jgi/Sobl393_1/140/SZX74879.1